MISALLSAGVFVALPLTGRILLGRLDSSIAPIARLSVWVAAGAAVWSVPLLGSIAGGFYQPEVLGAVAWLVATAATLLLLRRRANLVPRPHLRRADVVVIGGLLAAGLLGAAFPADPFVTTRDQTTYASHADGTPACE